MPTYEMNCDCGDTMNMDAPNRSTAVAELQAMMTPDLIAKHMAEKHPSEPALSVDQVHAMIEAKVQPMT